MAKGRVKMVCAECGAEYWAEKTCCNRSEANRWEAWMQGQEGCCSSCYAKRRAAERAADREAENAAAAARAAELNLPALEGSEKQVAWATTIRQEALDSALRAAAEPAKAERLMRLMQNLASRCNTLDKQWAKIVEER